MLPSGILTCCTGPFWSDSLFLFGFCLPSLRCLISALTQAGGGDLLFRFASSVQSCCGEGGALQADVAVCGEHSLWPGSQRFGALSTGAPRLFPPQPQRGQPVRSQEVFRQEPGPVCRVGGGGFSGAEFVPFPYRLPPTSSGDGAALLWSFSVPLFCEPPAVCSCRSVFLSFSHSLKKSPYDCSQGLLAGPHPKQCRRLLSVHPLLLVAGAGVWGTFLLGVAFRHVICGPYLISPPS